MFSKQPVSEQESPFLKHINAIKIVLEQMDVSLRFFQQGNRGKVYFGEYTSPGNAFINSNTSDWMLNSIQAQTMRSIPAMLEYGIETHVKRVQILNTMYHNLPISFDDLELLKQVEALRNDEKITRYVFIQPVRCNQSAF
jgi:hypothetical protein